jgi:hypothetical protein
MSMPNREGEIESVLVEMRQRLGSRGAARGAGADDARRDLLARIDAGASVASRASARLPPVMSDRGGWRARVEIALKRFARRATNWFTWEQVNFNAAAADALRAAHVLLKEQVVRESELRARIDALEAEAEGLRREREGV